MQLLPPDLVATVDAARRAAWSELTPAFRALLARKAGLRIDPSAGLEQLLPDDAERMQAALTELERQASAARRCLGWRARQGRAARSGGPGATGASS